VIRPHTQTLSLVSLLVSLVLLLTAVPADAAPAPADQRRGTSDTVTAPGYESSRLTVTVKGKPRATKRVKLVVKGTNKQQESGSYTLSAYVVDRRVLKKCPWFGDMRDFYISNPDAAYPIAHEQNLNLGGRFKKTVYYKSGGARKVLYCTYVRWIIDDVSVNGTRHLLRRR
jgi:hypothetical protein